MIGFNRKKTYFLGGVLCALFLSNPVSAELNQQSVNDELKEAYKLLFMSPQVNEKQSYSQHNSSRQRVVLSAKKQLRKRYRWGGTSPKTGFDCSGLMQYAYKSIKVNIPRTAREQYKYTKRISLAKLQAGDLIFFHTRRTRVRVNHVGLYLGDGEFIHAPRRGKRVSVAKLNKYWRRKAVGAGRI